MYAWVQKFVRHSWDMSADDIEVLRDAGVSDHEIVVWAQIAALQTYLVTMGDGGGVSLDDGRPAGLVVGRDRPSYTQTAGGLLAAAPGEAATPARRGADAGSWVAVGESSIDYERAAGWAVERYGFVPNLLEAVRSEPRFLRNNTSAMELLEGPQSDTLSPRQHALVRALVSSLNRCSYSAVTTRARLRQFDGGDALYETVTGPWQPDVWDDEDRIVLEFAIKTARNAYKIVERDAQAFRDAGLGDEGYVDVLNTAAIQTSLDRLANSLGVVADDRPLLVRQPSAA
jgi:uncharacterized peroxidase-related enzyme